MPGGVGSAGRWPAVSTKVDTYQSSSRSRIEMRGLFGLRAE